MAVAFDQIFAAAAAQVMGQSTVSLTQHLPPTQTANSTILLCYDIKPISVTGAEKKSQGYRGMQYNRFQ